MASFKYQLIFTLSPPPALAGCSQPSPQELKEKTAAATAEAKSDAQAVADGIKEGWDRARPLDLNSPQEINW